MQKFGLQPSSHTYDGFVRAITSEQGFSSGMEIVSYIGLLHRPIILKRLILQLLAMYFVHFGFVFN